MRDIGVEQQRAVLNCSNENKLAACFANRIYVKAVKCMLSVKRVTNLSFYFHQRQKGP